MRPRIPDSDLKRSNSTPDHALNLCQLDRDLDLVYAHLNDLKRDARSLRAWVLLSLAASAAAWFILAWSSLSMWLQRRP